MVPITAETTDSGQQWVQEVAPAVVCQAAAEVDAKRDRGQRVIVQRGRFGGTPGSAPRNRNGDVDQCGQCGFGRAPGNSQIGRPRKFCQPGLWLLGDDCLVVGLLVFDCIEPASGFPFRRRIARGSSQVEVLSDPGRHLPEERNHVGIFPQFDIAPLELGAGVGVGIAPQPTQPVAGGGVPG